MPEGGARVEVSEGTYPLARPLDLSSFDSGTPQKPIVYQARAGQEVRLIGGKTLGAFSLVTAPAILARLDESARGKVWQSDLRAQGITNFGLLQGGSSWAQSDPGLELFFQDQPMTLARWPNKGYIKMVDVLGPTPVDIRGTVGCAEGIFSYDTDRPNRWAGESEVMVHGFWFWDWADQRHKVTSIDVTNKVITVAAPYHSFGYRKGQWFYAFNLLSEIDQPGEWFLDRQTGLLYFWPPAPTEQGRAMVSLLPAVITLTNVSNITLRGFIIEGCQGTAISIAGGSTNLVQACTVRNAGKTGIRIANSPGSGISGCDVFYTGDGAISLSGGDRATLTPAGIFAEHNHIHHWSRWNPVYKQGINLGGVGNRASHNLIHDAPHEAIGFGGNDHLMEFNEIHSVVKESNDAGVIYAGRTWTARGHIIRFNYIHHIYGFERRGCNGVYLD
ncbi:MAG TPA: right-handed parallel beta-helix repeat-containing protein, partial [Tepidisphaeraceae bacterium]|nr:right-handed parallel beta-helix repeat-containing protein [Tepidisphaeraceae bacterium]